MREDNRYPTLSEPDPQSEQVGGSHYQNMGIQPERFAMLAHYDCDTFSILKYITRHGRKAGATDLKKAVHFVKLRRASYGVIDDPRSCAAGAELEEYIDSNQIPVAEATILKHNHLWAMESDNLSEYTHQQYAEILILLIEQLISKTYPESKNDE